MNWEGMLPDGTWIPLGAPLSVRLVQEEEAPADGLALALPFRRLPWLARVRGTRAGKPVFTGTVDEQEAQWSSSGAVVRLEARGLAGLLMDSEALPQTYRNPSLPVLFARHGAPFGLKGWRGPEAAVQGEFPVGKGVSDWDVLAGFCREFLQTAPRVTPEGVFDAGGAPGGEIALGRGGAPCLEASRGLRRCALFGELYAPAGEGFAARFSSPLAARLGVVRRRVLAGEGDGAAVLRRAEREAREVRALCRGWLEASPGDRARVDLPLLGGACAGAVAAKTYRMDADGETTALVVRIDEEGF